MIFSIVKLDLFIQALLLDRILALEKNYAYVSRTSCFLGVYVIWRCDLYVYMARLLYFTCISRPPGFDHYC